MYNVAAIFRWTKLLIFPAVLKNIFGTIPKTTHSVVEKKTLFKYLSFIEGQMHSVFKMPSHFLANPLKNILKSQIFQ